MSQEQQKKGGVDATLARHGGLSYLEIPAVDAAASALFYERVLGWKTHGADSGTPQFSDADGLLIGRWIVGRAAAREEGMIHYFYVNDIRKAVSETQAAGGQIVRSPYPEGNLLVAAVRDPARNLIGLWQAGS